MDNQIIDNSGKLSPNTFVKDGYTFAGWATSADGPVVYTDGAEITATENDKGSVSLYAVWEVGDYDPVINLWTLETGNTCISDRMTNPSISFSELDGSIWNVSISQYNNNDSISYRVKGNSRNASKFGIFSIYMHEENMPSYSRMNMSWTFRLGSKSKQHHSTVCLYGLSDSLTQIQNLAVDFSDKYVYKTGSEYLLAAPFTNTNQDGNTLWGDPEAVSLTFDNSTGDIDQPKKWYILITYVMCSAGSKEGLEEVGFIKSLRLKKTWTYYKVISFNANGGSGTMDQTIVDNIGILPANAFTRAGYTFAGWATSADGAVEYADEAAITANAETKGAYTLYAVWTPENYTISYDLDGGEATNPASYTEATETFTLTNPTQDGYTFLGWTGSNGDVPQASVAIVKGSTGNKSFTARWMSNAVATTQDLITAIGEVTIDSGEAIAAARAAYNALSTEDQAFVSNYTTLTAAEAAYEAARDAAGNTTIQFIDQDNTLVTVQTIQLDYPEAPKISGYTFQYWRVAEKNLSGGTIRLQAVYTSTPTDIEETPFPSGEGRGEASKFIKEGNVYILKDEFIYTINGQRVK
jgi:uncharacterized repeat protein (TIGR02543 family)